MNICRQKKKRISTLLFCAFCTVVFWGYASRPAEPQNDSPADITKTNGSTGYGENFEDSIFISDEMVTSVDKEVWERAAQDFRIGKKEMEISICWKDLDKSEIEEKKVLGWFLLLAESLDGAI